MDFLTEAARYALIGFKVFPQKPGSKEPATAHGVHDATDDVDVLAEWTHQYPGANIAAACGPTSGILVVDIDKQHGGIENFQQLLNRHGTLPKCPMARSPQGGCHLYFRYDRRIATSQNKLGQGIEVRSRGAAITLPPSRWDGYKKGVKVAEPGDYKWVRAPLGSHMPPMPHWMLKLLLPKPVPRLMPKPWDRNNVELVQAEKVLRFIPNHDYTTWISVGMALKSEFGDEAFDVWNSWSCAGYSKHSTKECQLKWKSFKRRHGVGIGSVFHEARIHGADLKEILRST